MSIWQTLGVDERVAVADLRRRYAALIKEFRPETHPQEFARIRDAYEVALPWARRREAELAEDAAGPAVARDADAAVQASRAGPDPSVAAEEAAAEPRAVGDVAEVADAPDVGQVADTPLAAALDDSPAAPPDDEPRLAAQFRHFRALAEAAAGTRDAALLPTLRALLQARSSASLDDSQALEFALMRWFIETEDPPLTLLFETGRAFGWHAHDERLSGWLSPWALRQMDARLSLSRDLAWARHFSGNRWLRRLHAPTNEMALMGCRPQMQDALRWAERWRLASGAADAKALASHLNAQTLRRLQGHELLSTDLITGLAIACTATDLPDVPIYVVIGTALTFALRLAALWLRPVAGPTRLPRPIADQLAHHPGVTFLLGIGVGGLGLAILAVEDAGDVATAIGWLLILPALLMGLTGAWRGLSWAERAVADLFAWRDAVDRLEFDQHVRSSGSAAAPAPRMTQVQRWKSIPAAMRLRRREVALRTRPAQTLWFQRFGWLGRMSALPRILWVVAWIAFAILHYTHAFGARP
jgi:hypothetical protein